MTFAPAFSRLFSSPFSRQATITGNALLDGLVAYWPGNEASGDLLDGHVYGKDATDTNTVGAAARSVYEGRGLRVL